MAVREKPYRCRRHAEGISGQRREKTERIHPAESREPLIEAEAVSLSYDGGEPLLNDIHFKIEPETLYCLMGANGCGKSTLINCILGMHEPDRGEIRIGGRPVSEYRPKELAKRVAFVPQVHERTFPYTVEQVVLMGRNAYSRALSGPEAIDRKMVKEGCWSAPVSRICRSARILVSAEERCSWRCWPELWYSIRRSLSWMNLRLTWISAMN